ncbi:MAG: SxtJ family membrane protein [Candidatus Neomarinimicrobiota bacterium]
MTAILGISAFYHDSAACLIQDGKITAAAQEERFSRIKHDYTFPRHAIAYCLEEGGIDAGDLTYVAFYDKPWIKFERLLETYLTYAPVGIHSFLKAMPLWLKQKLWMSDLIGRELGYDGEIIFPEHHQSHAASTFLASPFERSAIITADGVGEWTTTSWGTGSGNRVDLRYELRFPHSLGLLYSAFTYYTGFKVNSDEYKVMGLAPYGEPSYAQQILDELLDLREDGSFRINMEYFNFAKGLTMTSRRFHRLFGGPPREAGEPLTVKDMDLARSVQVVTEEIMLRMARHVKRQTGESHLCLAGGVALNSVANGKILREGIYDKVWIQPAAGDAGGALGAALVVWNHVLDQPRQIDGIEDQQRGSYLGPSYSVAEIEKWLQEERIPHERHDARTIPQMAADLIAQGKVVGWFSGRMEFGPRALGNRSILGAPRNPQMQSIINQKIKFRESFRPFAPSCLLEDTEDYFDLKEPSPYMLLVTSVKESRRRPLTDDERDLTGLDLLNVHRSDIPAVTHVDYSARVQTVHHQDNPRFYALIQAFKAITGYGIVINTSFNVRGEPIVCTPQEAYQCFMRTEMDALFLEDLVLLKTDQPVSQLDSSQRQPSRMDRLRSRFRSGPNMFTDRDRRRFGLTMAAALAALGGLFVWRDTSAWPYLFGLAAFFTVTGLLCPKVLGPIQVGWMTFGKVLSRVATTVVLTLFYYMVITPVGLMLRLVGKDFLLLKKDAKQTSYWLAMEQNGPGSRPFKPY